MICRCILLVFFVFVVFVMGVFVWLGWSVEELVWLVDFDVVWRFWGDEFLIEIVFDLYWLWVDLEGWLLWVVLQLDGEDFRVLFYVDYDDLNDVLGCLVVWGDEQFVFVLFLGEVGLVVWYQ